MQRVLHTLVHTHTNITTVVMRVETLAGGRPGRNEFIWMRS